MSSIDALTKFIGRRSNQNAVGQFFREEMAHTAANLKTGAKDVYEPVAIAARIESYDMAARFLAMSSSSAADRRTAARRIEVQGLHTRVKQVAAIDRAMLTDQLKAVEQEQREAINALRRELPQADRELLDSALLFSSIGTMNNHAGVKRTVALFFSGTMYAWLLANILSEHPELGETCRALVSSMEQSRRLDMAIRLRSSRKGPTPAQSEARRRFRESQGDALETLFEHPFVAQSFAMFMADHLGLNDEGKAEESAPAPAGGDLGTLVRSGAIAREVKSGSVGKLAGFFGAAVGIVVGIEGLVNRLEQTPGTDVALVLHELGANLWTRTETVSALMGTGEELRQFDSSINVRLPQQVLADVRGVIARLEENPAYNEAAIVRANTLLAKVQAFDVDARADAILWPMVEFLYAGRETLQSFENELSGLQRMAAKAPPVPHSVADKQAKRRAKNARRAEAAAIAAARLAELRAQQPPPAIVFPEARRLTYAEVLLARPQIAKPAVKSDAPTVAPEASPSASSLPPLDLFPPLRPDFEPRKFTLPDSISHETFVQVAWRSALLPQRNEIPVRRLSGMVALGRRQADGRVAAVNRLSGSAPAPASVAPVPTQAWATAPVVEAPKQLYWQTLPTHDVRVATRLVTGSWDKATFVSPLESVLYHFGRHAAHVPNYMVEDYTVDGLLARNEWNGAWECERIDGLGKARVVRNANNYLVFGDDDKIITYRNRRRAGA